MGKVGTSGVLLRLGAGISSKSPYFLFEMYQKFTVEILQC